MKSTVMLTEHLQYPAVSLVDDIINAVNEIMYKCTAAMEKYLLEKHEIDGKDYTDEIKVGIAKLETLLENSVDKNFDKLELYVLRNVLRIPQDLLDANAFRLKYQRNLVIASESQNKERVEELELKVRQIEQAFEKHEELRRRIQNTKILNIKLKKFKQVLLQVLECKDSETREILSSLAPINDSLKLITSQLRQMYLDSEEYGSMEKVNDIVKAKEALESKLPTGSRSEYIETRTRLILEKLKIDRVQTEDTNLPNTVRDDAERNADIENPELSLLK